MRVMMVWFSRIAVIALVLATTASCTWTVRSTAYWHKPGATPLMTESAASQCEYQTNHPAPAGTYYTPSGTSVAVAASLVAVGMQLNRFKSCMLDKGFQRYAMTTYERVAVRSMTDEEFDAFYDKLVADGGENVRLGIPVTDDDLREGDENKR